MIHAHPQLDPKGVGLAVRLVPGGGLPGRRQIAEEISWGEQRDGAGVGLVEIDGQGAGSALAMLTLGQVTVQRQWFVDPERASNHRLLAAQHFDGDLKMLRRGVFELTDAAKFEAAVANLLFLLGFSAAVQLETDSPDLLVTTPAHRMLLVECTVKTADINTKLGKLVDRRASVAKLLKVANYPFDVAAALVCRQPREHIAAHADQIRAHGVILVTAADLSDAFQRLPFPPDPDALLSQAVTALSGPTAGDTELAT